MQQNTFSRETSFSSEVLKLFSNKEIVIPNPQVSNVLSCMRMSSCVRGISIKEDSWKYQYKMKLLDSKLFSVNASTLVLSDDENNISGIIDAVISRGNIKSIVKFFKNKENRINDDCDIIVCMFLSGIWNAISVYINEDGSVSNCFSVSPTEKESRAVLEKIFSISKEVLIKSIQGIELPARPGQHCPCCPSRNKCVEYGAREANSE